MIDEMIGDTRKEVGRYNDVRESKIACLTGTLAVDYSLHSIYCKTEV